VVLDLDRHPVVVAQVAAAERIDGVGGLGQVHEPVGVLDHPARVDAHVVGHHVAREADAAGPAAVAQVMERRLAAQFLGHDVVHQRVGRSGGLWIAAPLLDLLAGPAALPQTDQPQAGEAPPSQRVQLFVRDLVQAADPAAVLLGELVQPDERRLGHQHDTRHPVAVGAEALVLVLQAAQAGADGYGRFRRRMHPHPQRDFLFVQDVQGHDQAVQERRQHQAPARAHVAQLAGQGVGFGQRGGAQEGQQR
jgi:hypothetical protein